MKIFYDEITHTEEKCLNLVSGRFKSFKCPSCEGNGWYWDGQDWVDK